MTAPRRPRRWDLVVLALGAISATVSILFSGWVTVWFQLFGDQADRGDYAMASGLYSGGLLWLVIASVVAWLGGAPRWLSWWCWGASGLFAILWLSALQSARDPDREPAGMSGDTFSSGFQATLLSMPWNWLVLVSLVLALVFRATGRTES
jgi:hypothetical protein